MAIQVDIITPEKVVYRGEALSIAVPGVNGEFQMLKNHAPIVSALKEGKVRLELVEGGHMEFDDLTGEIEFEPDSTRFIRVPIKGGVLEFNNNKAIVLAD